MGVECANPGWPPRLADYARAIEVTITGPTGKTRLLREILSRADAMGFDVVAINHEKHTVLLAPRPAANEG